VSAYNFRRPDRVSKEQIRSLHLLHDRFARNATTSLAAYLRAITELSVVSVEQFSYAEFLLSLPDPTAFYAVAMDGFDNLAALELSPSVAFTIVDRMLGGTGQTGTPDRALTEIEQNVVDAIIKLILENLSDTWKTIQEDVHFRITGRETRPQMLQVAAPNESVLLLVFEVKICDARGILNFCVPASTIESVSDVFAQSWYRSRRDPSAIQRRCVHKSLGRVKMPVTAMLELSLPARELLELRPGDVLSLGRAVTQPVKVKIGRSTKFAARLVRNGTHGAVAVLNSPGNATLVAQAEGA